ncbi:MAG: XdhC family protein [Pseudomonadota bacterium]
MTTDDVSVDYVVPALGRMLAAGERVCLATLVQTDGSSPRPCGSQMAVAESGEFLGYLTGGCAEQAIADEGLRAIHNGSGHAMRFGVGSPYLDIQLPCGAGIDVWFDPSIDAAALREIDAARAARQTPALVTATRGGAKAAVSMTADVLDAGSFRRWYPPLRRLLIVGAGPIVTSLARQAAATEQAVEVLTPDAQTAAATAAAGVEVDTLGDPAQLDAAVLDAHTAAVLLFHEHEREPELLTRLLHSACYYVGALGSPRTHAVRLEALRRHGVDETLLGRIHGPVGLDIGARTPAEIAIAILAEMTRVYQRNAPALLDWAGGEL